MSEWVVLLRGINVGGINIKMADLRVALTAAGFTDVRTVLATGNVLLSSPLSVRRRTGGLASLCGVR